MRLEDTMTMQAIEFINLGYVLVLAGAWAAAMALTAMVTMVRHALERHLPDGQRNSRHPAARGA
jgi:hypothetical protein